MNIQKFTFDFMNVHEVHEVDLYTLKDLFFRFSRAPRKGGKGGPGGTEVQLKNQIKGGTRGYDFVFDDDEGDKCVVCWSLLQAG